MRHILSDLVRNLVAGLRTAFFAPVTRLAFRVDLAQVVLLFVVSAAIDLGRDWLRTDSDRVFSLLGAGTEFFGAGLFLFIAAMLALLYRQRAMAMVLAVITLSALPVLQVALELPPLPQAAIERLSQWKMRGV